MAPFPDSLEGQASQVLRTCVRNYHNVYGTGSMSLSVYDTAWVSMISKSINGETHWLFPLSFQYVLDQQESSGGWSTGLSDIDGILNTSAALLSLRKHIATPYQLDPEVVETVLARLPKAISSLRESFRNWDISSTNHVGFELLVPALLEMLEQEGIFFDFAGREQLLNVRAKKLSKFKIDMLYSKMQNPALHSLEAFIGKLDFDRVSHHKAFGSMMASPSSTAAYMMHCSTWDDESESYIRHVLSAGQGNGSGGVPSAFPTSLFELTWVVTNLFQNGFTKDGSDPQSLQKITDILKISFDSNEGLIGFAPCVFPDADDTAKGLVAMKLLGHEISCDKLVESFEGAEHFKTYSFERNPSLTTNCNVLSALLYSSNELRNRASQIAKIIKFLCRYWCQSDGDILDKWVG
ncbi:MAG: hypothetical protein Q9167_004832 [Letrouitia subvulpina]